MKRVIIAVGIIVLAAFIGHYSTVSNFVGQKFARPVPTPTVTPTPNPEEVERTKKFLEARDAWSREESDAALRKVIELQSKLEKMNLKAENLERKYEGKPVKPEGLSKDDSALWDTLNSLDNSKK